METHTEPEPEPEPEPELAPEPEPEPEPEPPFDSLLDESEEAVGGSFLGLGKDKAWSEMTEDERQAVAVGASSVGLGKDKMWSEMTEDERQAVVELGWSQVSWDNDGANATLLLLLSVLQLYHIVYRGDVHAEVTYAGR
jgi:hypothetical protein